MSAEAPEIHGLIETHFRLLEDAGVVQDYRAALGRLREVEETEYAARGADFSDVADAYDDAISGDNVVLARLEHIPNPEPGGIATMYILTQISSDEFELPGAPLPVADRYVDGSVFPTDLGPSTLTPERADLVARLATELEATAWWPS